MPRIPAKVFKCTKCVKTYKWKSDLTRHQNTCHISKPTVYTCTTCKKTFTRLDNLGIHVKTVHLKTKNYCCVFCEKQFGRVDKLNQHIISHVREKHFFCDVCDKELSTSRELRNHKRLHTKQNLFKCSQCSKAYATLVNLQVHRLNHEPKCFQCVICLNMFASNKNLELHILKHVNEKPFFCTECDEEFRIKNDLTLHLKRGQCNKKMATRANSFSIKERTSQTEKSDGQDREEFMDEDSAQEPTENHAEIGIPNVCLPGKRDTGTLPLNRAPDAVPEANTVRETTKLPEVRVCEVCGEQFFGEKLDKDYANHIVTNKHYLHLVKH